MTALRALIADDSPTLRLALRRLLAELGIASIEAGDGCEALGLLERDDQLGLALVDWQMPRLDGLGFIRAVRSSRHAALPVLMVTQETDPAKLAQARAAGADACLLQALHPGDAAPEVDPPGAVGARR